MKLASGNREVEPAASAAGHEVNPDHIVRNELVDAGRMLGLDVLMKNDEYGDKLCKRQRIMQDSHRIPLRVRGGSNTNLVSGRC